MDQWLCWGWELFGCYLWKNLRKGLPSRIYRDCSNKGLFPWRKQGSYVRGEEAPFPQGQLAAQPGKDRAGPQRYTLLSGDKNDTRERLTFCPNWNKIDQRRVVISLISFKEIISELVSSGHSSGITPREGVWTEASAGKTWFRLLEVMPLNSLHFFHPATF